MNGCKCEKVGEDVSKLRGEMNLGFTEVRSDIKSLLTQVTENKIKVEGVNKFQVMGLSLIFGVAGSLIKEFIKFK